MRPGRVLLVLLLIAAALGTSVLFTSRAIRSLHASGFFDATTPGLLSAPPTPPPARARSPHHPKLRRSTNPARRAAASSPRVSDQRSSGLLHLGNLRILLVAGLEVAGGLGLIGVFVIVLLLRRTRRRLSRRYALYELRLSMHDQAKPQDLEDMLESIANIIRVFPAERARNGQPYVALELICGERQDGTEWSLNVRCEARVIAALDGAISAAYPDVRVGRTHAESPVPRTGALRVPGYVMRFRKQRSFVYPLLASGEQLASPPMEQIARAQVALGAASIVRFQLTPTPSFFEEYARRLYKRHEHKLVRQERTGRPAGGLGSTLNRAEMSNAQRTQNRSLFWLEVIIAADSLQACKTVAATVQARRGENRLQRRWMIIRQRLYRRRFPHALGPLIPSMRCLVSAAEAAQLLELPTARIKGVPVRRLTLPRIPLAPEIVRARRPRTAHPTGTPPDRRASTRAQARPNQPPAAHHTRASR